MSCQKLTVLAVVVLAGCTSARLYPIEGPLSQNKPIPVIKARVSGILGNNGKISLTLPDGEFCEGEWSVTAGVAVGYTSGTLFGTYGSVYGSGMSVSTSGGTNMGQAMLVGERGTTIEVEFRVGSGTANGFGFAKDSNGNVYKVLF